MHRFLLALVSGCGRFAFQTQSNGFNQSLQSQFRRQPTIVFFVG
jgi:hypothetical protein